MRKRFAALAILANTIFLLISSSQSMAVSNDSILNRQKAVELVKDNSTAIWDALEEERFAKDDYEEQASRSKSIDLVKMFLFVNPYTDEDVYYYYDSAEQMQLKLMKEFLPESMKFNYEVKKMAIKITENAMANTADNLFAGLYSTYHSIEMAKQSLELAEKNLKREQERFSNGLITQLDLEESELELKGAKNALTKAKRDYDNMHRQFNSLTGLPLDFRYDLIGTPWTNENGILITEDQAIAEALANRMEIWSTKKQINLVIFRMEIYRHKNVHKFHQQTIEDYENALDELENLKLTLSQQEYEIEKEIRLAYQDLEKSYNDLELSKLNLARQKNQLETLKTQYQSGLVPISVVEQLELAVKQLEFSVNINLVNVLNKQDKLNRAMSVGPNY